MKENTKKTIYLGAAAFLFSIVSSLLTMLSVPILPAVFLCACAGCFALASLTAPSKLYIVIVPLSILCAFMITLSWSAAIVSASPFAAGFVIGIFDKKGKSKTSATLGADVAFGVLMLAGAAVAYFMANKTLAPSSVIASIDKAFDAIGEQMKKTLDDVNFYEMYSRVYEMKSGKEEFISTIVKTTLFMVKAIIPGLVISALNVISYVSCAFYALACRLTKTEIAIPDGKWKLLPKEPSAWMAVASTGVFIIFNMFSSSDFATAVQLASLNLAIILVPPFFVCGINGLVGRFRSPRFKMQAIVIVVIAAAMAVIMLPAGILYSAVFIALVGAWDIITLGRITRMKKNMNKEDEQ